ncbi:unnamed protein product [Lactuca virosa]|uniref:Uncharacterized protein n=1 Tax=Lactuca virosa TaxID=75947 RepID=A0AAU9M193_9ASTR|nr:unnamed protein product [Lactuca virosa]
MILKRRSTGNRPLIPVHKRNIDKTGLRIKRYDIENSSDSSSKPLNPNNVPPAVATGLEGRRERSISTGRSSGGYYERFHKYSPVVPITVLQLKLSLNFVILSTHLNWFEPSFVNGVKISQWESRVSGNIKFGVLDVVNWRHSRKFSFDT